MKYVVAVLFLLLGAAIAAVFFKHYTIVETATGGEWLILKNEQAKACKESPCAVFSENEFNAAVMTILAQLSRRKNGL